jgi:hypothetical protein
VYDMYPDDWGYSQHRAEPYDGPGARGGTQAVQSALDLRDNGGPRPDDN